MIEKKSVVLLSLKCSFPDYKELTSSSGNGTRSFKHISHFTVILHCKSQVSTSSDTFPFPLSLTSTQGGSGRNFVQSCTVMWEAEGSVHLGKSLTSNVNWGFVDGL